MHLGRAFCALQAGCQPAGVGTRRGSALYLGICVAPDGAASSAQGSPPSGQRESLSLTPKRAQNWANRSRLLDARARKKDLRGSESSDDDADWPRQLRGKGTVSSAPKAALDPHNNKSPAPREQDRTTPPVEGVETKAFARFDPWEAPTIVHNKQQLTPLTPEGTPRATPESSPEFGSLPVPRMEDPWEAPVVIHSKRTIKPVTSQELASAYPVGASSPTSLSCLELSEESPWEAPTVFHAKRCLMPLSPELGPTSPSEDIQKDESGLVPSLVGLTLSPWEEPVVIHAKRTMRPVTPEPMLGNTVDQKENNGPQQGPEAVTPEPMGRPSDFMPGELHARIERITADAVIQGVSWLTNNPLPKEEADSQPTCLDSERQGLTLAENDAGNEAGPKGVDAQDTSPTDKQNSAPRTAFSTKQKRNLPQHRVKARVAREISLLVKGSDDEEDEIKIRNLSALGISPRIVRAKQGDDSDEELRVRRMRAAAGRRQKSSAPQPSSDEAAAEALTKTGGDASPSHDNTSTNVVERRMASVLKPLKSAIWSDDDDDDPRTTKGPMLAASSQHGAQEEAMEALLSAKKLVRLERKAMHLAQASDSDDEDATSQMAPTPKRNVIQREIDLRMSGAKARPVPASSVSSVPLSVLDEAEREWVLVEEEGKPDPRPPPTSFGTPLRSKKLIPGRRATAGGYAGSVGMRSGMLDNSGMTQ